MTKAMAAMLVSLTKEVNLNSFVQGYQGEREASGLLFSNKSVTVMFPIVP